MWWRDAVIYQIYPRSFQDSNGDGVGDLPGILSRLNHIERLGASAIWLSPFYPSPNADFGYDVADYTAVDPDYGTLEDFDDLIAAAHERGLRVIVDFVPCHTSIEHPWFRERPGFYHWADAPVNNWLARFGGSAWERDPVTGRYYLHSFFPEQPDLNWRNPDVRAEMQSALRFWLERGVDGFRLDAIVRLFKDPELRDDPPASEPFGLPLPEEYGRLSHVNSANAPDIGVALGAIREAVGDALLIGEAYLPTAQLRPYTEILDVLFAFEAMNAGADADRLKTTVAAAIEAGKLGWVLSNHDFARFATRFGENFRAACVLFSLSRARCSSTRATSSGLATVRAWTQRSTATSGTASDTRCSGTVPPPVASPPGSRGCRPTSRSYAMWLTRSTTRTPCSSSSGASSACVATSRQGHGCWTRRPEPSVLERGEYLVAVNLGDASAPFSRRGDLALETRRGDGADPDTIPAHAAWIARG